MMQMSTPEIPNERDECAGIAQVGNLIHRGAMCQALKVAVELGIPDLLARGPKGADELAAATASHASSLARLLKALATIDFCHERADGRFTLAATGEALRADGNYSLRHWLLWFGQYQWPFWARLDYSIRTGSSARKLSSGADGFAHLEDDAGAAAAFNAAMAELSELVAAEVLRLCDFAGINTVMDVGGGSGALLAAILRSHAMIQGILFDRPHALSGARARLTSGISERCTFIAGDFFAEIPAAADLVLLKNVVHDWSDEQAAVILHNCRRALVRSGKLLLIERIMPPRLEADPNHLAIAWADLTMLLGPGGRERTEAEFHTLLASAGFGVLRITPTALEYSIIEAAPSSG
jgi:orsellinic acid C2-O-methyltransferase